MKEQSTSIEAASRVCYETMEAHARGPIQSWLQDLLEAKCALAIVAYPYSTTRSARQTAQWKSWSPT